jgi:micrococcal nuclease
MSGNGEGMEPPVRARVCRVLVGMLGASVFGLLAGCSTGTAPRSLTSVAQPAATASMAEPAAVSSGLTRPADALGPYAVTRVVDGDTDEVSIDGRSVKLRLIGIDTPETKDPRKPVQCFGQEASARAETLLTGRKVWIEYDTSQDRRDRYGRDLVYVWLDDHTMFNEVMVRDGFAHEYTYDRPYRYQAQFLSAQTKAKAAGLGFWSLQTCSGDTKKKALPGTLLPVPAPTKPVPTQVVPTPGVSASYASCTAARAAGAAPIYRGQPGYSAKLDRDGNGIACQ